MSRKRKHEVGGEAFSIAPHGLKQYARSDAIEICQIKIFPAMQGFSTRNLHCMRKLAEEYPDPAIVQQVVAQLPWGHILRITQRIKQRREPEDFAGSLPGVEELEAELGAETLHS